MAPDKGLAGWLRRRGIPFDSLQRIGATYREDRDELRVPVASLTGEVIYEVVRSFAPDAELRYRYPKGIRRGFWLFGLREARRSIRDLKQAVVVEGLSDALSLWAHGVPNAVAAMGSHMTPAQWALLDLICDSVIVLADGDDAGRRFAQEASDGSRYFTGSVIGAVIPGFDPGDFTGAGGDIIGVLSMLDDLRETYRYAEIASDVDLYFGVTRAED